VQSESRKRDEPMAWLKYEWKHLQQMVCEESSTLMEYSFLRNNRLAIWIEDVNVELVYHAVIDTTTDSSNSIATLLRWLHESIDDSEISSLDLRRVGTEDDFETEYSSQIKSAADKKLEVTMEKLLIGLPLGRRTAC